jgi:radical SAM protein with 4Fe4S-binding SPASM domain
LSWVDQFWARAGNYIFSREEDGVLILSPNRVYKINPTGAALIRFLKEGGKIADLIRQFPERLYPIEEFFKTLGGLYSGGADSKLRRSPFSFDFTRLPILGEIAVTYRCNNRCVFCYAGTPRPPSSADPGPAEYAGVANRAGMGDISAGEWKKIIRLFKEEAKIPFFSFTGGEPLLRRDLEELIAYAVSLGLEVNLVSNGTLADNRRAASLYEAGLRTAQISVEAPEAELHDSLAGRDGAFAETAAGIKALAEAGISVQTNTTITRRNIAAVPEMPPFLAGIGIRRFAMNMYIPAAGPLREDLFVGYDEIGAVVDLVRKRAFASGLTFYWYSPTPFCYYNPIARGMGNKSCAAADGLISAAANGDLLPCSSWDEPIGNLLTEPFGDLWFSERARFFKHKHFAPESCKTCASFTACQGACPLYWRFRGEGLLEGSP